MASSEERRLFGNTEHDPRSPLFNGIETGECECCKGTGKDFFSCCGDDMRGSDLDLCPSCHKHTGWDGSSYGECTECDGEGYIIL